MVSGQRGGGFLLTFVKRGQVLRPPPHPLGGLGDALPPRNDDWSPWLPSRKQKKFCPEPRAANPWANAWANPKRTPPICGQTPGQTVGKPWANPSTFWANPSLIDFLNVGNKAWGYLVGPTNLPFYNLKKQNLLFLGTNSPLPPTSTHPLPHPLPLPSFIPSPNHETLFYITSTFLEL